MPAEYKPSRPCELAADRWILEPDARSAIVEVHPLLTEAVTLVGRTIRVDVCEYRCVAVTSHAPERRSPAGTRLRRLVQSV